MKKLFSRKILKLTCALLCAVMLALPLTGCGDKRNETDKDFSLSTLPAVDPNTVPEASKGFSPVKSGTYTILCHNPSNGLLGFVGEGTDLVEKEIYLRNARLREEYSVDFREMTVTGSTADFIRTSTLSGLVNYDMAAIPYRSAVELAMSDSLCALSELGGYSQSGAMFSNSLSSGGEQYIMDLDLFSSRVSGTYAMALNRELMPDILRKSPVSNALAGELTYEYFDRLASEAEIYFQGDGMAAFWSGGGVRFYLKGSDGDMPVYKRLGEEAENVYSSIKALFDEGILNDRNSYDGTDTEQTAEQSARTFRTGASKNFLSVGTVEQIKHAIKDGVKLELLPLPKLNKKAAYSSFVSPDALCTVIPAGDTDKNSVTFALAAQIFKYSLDGALKEELTALIGSEKAETAKIFDIIASSRIFDLPAMYNVGGMYEFLGKSLKNNVLPDAYVEGINNRTQTAVVAIEIIKESSKKPSK